MKTVITILALIVYLIPLNADAASKKVKRVEAPKETLYVCGVELYLGMKRDAIEKSLSGCDDRGSDKENITLWQDKNVVGVISFNYDNRVTRAYREWHTANDSSSELVKTLVEAVNSMPETVRNKNSANVYVRNEPNINEHSMIVWFQGKKSIRLETIEIKQDKRSYVSIREFLEER
ncbi:hypothetical protein GMST_15520 [Geomonas silvestris]|uniref:Lipoprotein n=1 Tax=Geomonas silvestris TaxID=2740184 RepID=A0A6V8MGX9_9BACT|nr:hypothetical protein [Geomonas silvestris]GFO59227.1 hypothetical protein GMST_15520 [Geomonas silvestris]